jgi:hypothetical protein
MQKTRRWEIALCDRGTVHVHYGTGSLYILKEDFVGLAVELQRLYYGARLTDTHSHRTERGYPQSRRQPYPR